MKESILRKITLSAMAFLMVFAPAYAQQKVTVTGTVTDESGLPVASAGIFQKGTNNGIVSDVDGKYSITVDAGSVLVYIPVWAMSRSKRRL